jgi:hypothetical protein
VKELRGSLLNDYSAALFYWVVDHTKEN